jgi:hypothetical protein
MPDFRQVRTALMKRILEGTGMTEPDKRDAAFTGSINDVAVCTDQKACAHTNRLLMAGLSVPGCS